MLNHLRKPVAVVASIALLAVCAPAALDGGSSSSGAVQSASVTSVTP